MISVSSKAAPLAMPAGVVAFATAVVVATEFIVVGLLPAMARDLRIPLSQVGHFVSAFALSSAVFGPLLMIPAARWDPRLVMVLALIPFALGNLAAALMPGYAMLLLARILQGATLPVLVSAGSAAVASLAGPGREGRAVSLIYIGVVAGMVVAMPAGTVLADMIGWHTTFVVLGALALVAALALFAGFPPMHVDEAPSMLAQLAILRRPVLQAQLLLSAILFAAMFTPYTYLGAFLEIAGGLDALGAAAILAGFGLAGIPGNVIAGRLSDRGPTRATIWVVFILAAAMAAAAFAGDRFALLLPVLAVWGAAHASAFLLSQMRVMLSASTAPAFASALNISAANIGIAAGAVIGGAIVEGAGIAATGAGGSGLAILAFVIAAWLRSAGVR
jgi:MFS transporter, DHA1 family, inner membrane transport protein